MCFPEMSFVFLSAILWLLHVFCFKMLNISAGSRHWSNRRSRTQDAADADILWARSRFEPRCSQIQWTVGRTRQLLGVCSWWKRWSQWSPHLLWELSHVQKPGWSAWYTLPYSKEKGNIFISMLRHEYSVPSFHFCRVGGRGAVINKKVF